MELKITLTEEQVEAMEHARTSTGSSLTTTEDYIIDRVNALCEGWMDNLKQERRGALVEKIVSLDKETFESITQAVDTAIASKAVSVVETETKVGDKEGETKTEVTDSEVRS